MDNNYYNDSVINTPEEAMIKRNKRRENNNIKEYNKYVIIDPVALIRATSMAAVVANKTDGKEMMGFIIGQRILDSNENIKQLIIEDVVFTGCSSDHAATEMDAIQMRNANKEARSRGLKTLGWVHSHPHFSVTPSSIDTATNKTWEAFMKDPLMLIVNETDFYIGTTRYGREKKLPFIIREKSDTKIANEKISAYEVTEAGVNVSKSVIDNTVREECTKREYYETNIFNPFGIFTFVHFIGSIEIAGWNLIKYGCYIVGNFLGDMLNKIFGNKRIDTNNHKINQINKKLKAIGDIKNG